MDIAQTNRCWSKHFVEWEQDGVACLSVAFTWDLPAAFQRAA